MARSPTSKIPKADAPGPRDRIIDALMALAGDMRWDEITLSMIAARADVSLADLRDHYPSKGAIIGGFSKRIDRIVLDGSGGDMLGEPARERVLDVMMRRLDAMAPYKAGLKEIRRAAGQDPLMLAALNQMALNSWRYMLAAADIETEDELGMVRIQGAALVFLRTLDTWFEDEGEDLARTMARLDKELGQGERIMGRLQDLQRLAAPFRGFFRAAMERRTSHRPAGEERASF
ncbi:MAG: TetR/AcrR family transcriptional regulator [Methylocystis sp.]|nr:TetR/AcrR family transcriptional regulator [Methylocystis sp.]MCA3583779.1 TetR/AcrR family transcriptional regulator [Methylocystis sp.]MCA3586452.1 TetR/AcrR family transcriptional regulator [Methylocystis sp.]MCA3589947.1 TetR/AcrR family transcriptional regulator [Methylocystis sp.]